jgi:hypothetical protein
MRRVRDYALLLGHADVVWITLDTLRCDVAEAAQQAGELPQFSAHLPPFERRYTSGSFTFAAHQAFLAGFLPTPMSPGPHPRPFALQFPGSETIGAETLCFGPPQSARSIPEGFALNGYRTLCVGGTGFFNPATPLGSVLPGLFAHACWRPEFGVTALDSTDQQVAFLLKEFASHPDQPWFVLLNVSALHQPNCGYVAGATVDSVDTQRAALRYVDAALAPLWTMLAQRNAALVQVFADHGTCYGEDGHVGHRVAHPVVMQVPYTEALLGTNASRYA